MKKIKVKIEQIVDKTDAKIVDRISISLFVLLGVLALYLFFCTFGILSKPILVVHSKILYTFILVLDLMLFYFTMLGDKTSKPINRPKVFILISVILGICVYSMLAEVINQGFIGFLNSLIGIDTVPNYLLITNIRIMSIYVPVFIVIVVFYDSFKIPFTKESKKELLEYSIDILTRNIYEVSERTINVKICEDIASGEDIILSETMSKNHTFIGGSSGSGKTALVLSPMLAQLFYQKAIFREKIKERAFKCLEEGICYLKGPLSEKFINNNFSMDFVGIRDGKRKEFLNEFKDLIIGVREGEKILYNSIVIDEKINIPINHIPDVKNRQVSIKVCAAGLELEEYNFEYKDGILTGNNVITDEYSINLDIKSNIKSENEENANEELEDSDEKKINIDVCEISGELLTIDIKTTDNKKKNYKFKVNVIENTEGKIIYKDLGVTVVAPDGGLPEKTLEIAARNGIKVHKIDPKMEEINKGHIAKFNPLMVGTPEKAADVISSILVSMLESTGNNNNSYYINASIRAIRNLVILLRVTYPELRGKNPTLLDVLDILNDFNSVKPYVEALKEDSRLEKRYSRVISYFVSSFYPQPKDDKGTLSFTTNEGVKRKKTEEAVSGIIAQLDNLLGREELRYILCDTEEGINLSDILENGECLAIATRQSELGEILGKAFALMFILSMQNAVLCRYSEDENPEIPNYLFIDEFPFYLNDGLKVFFTFSRKYKCSVVAVIQNIAQLNEQSETFKEIIISNTGTKIILPGSNVEDRKYYSELLGVELVFEAQTGVSQNPILTENANYSETQKGSIQEKNIVSTQDLADLQFKRCFYKYTNSKGKNCVGKGYIDFLKFDESNVIELKNYNFSKFDFEEEYLKEENKKVVNFTGASTITSRETVNIYKDIQEINIDELNVDFESEIFNNNEEDGEYNKEDTINNDIKNEELTNNKTINLLEKKLLKASINKSENKTEKIAEEDGKDIVDSNNKYDIMTKTNDKFNIDNIDIENLTVEGLSQK